MTRNIEIYYDNTEIDLPHKNVKSFIEMKTNVGNAIDLFKEFDIINFEEIEKDGMTGLGNEFDTIEKLIDKISELELPIYTDNYFVKKAEIGLDKVLNKEY